MEVKIPEIKNKNMALLWPPGFSVHFSEIQNVKFLFVEGQIRSHSVTLHGCWHDNMAWHVATACSEMPVFFCNKPYKCLMKRIFYIYPYASFILWKHCLLQQSNEFRLKSS